MPSPIIYDTSKRFCFDGLPLSEQILERAEEADLLELVKTASRSYIDGDRRIGKTTLVMSTLGKAKIPVLRIDLEGITSLEKLVERMHMSLRSFLDEYPAVRKKLFSTEKTNTEIGASILGLNFKIGGEKSVAAAGIENNLDAILHVVTEVARRAGGVVFVDEFQEVKNFNIDKPEEIMGSFASASDPAKTKNEVCFLFAGSNRHEMRQIFSGIRSKFYQQARTFTVNAIPEAQMLPFLEKRFGAEISKEIGKAAYAWTQGIPGDLQRLYSAMKRITGDRKVITMADLVAAEDAVVADVGRNYALTVKTRPVDEKVILDNIASLKIFSITKLWEAPDIQEMGVERADAAMEGLLRSGLINIPSNSDTIRWPEPILHHYLERNPALAHRDAGHYFPRPKKNNEILVIPPSTPLSENLKARVGKVSSPSAKKSPHTPTV